ncbi:hypothetical protein NERG_01784 [Nematocida ausubeli]|uniref:Uncharacterized protein n=1 Tax=Nematocida ausubeli (strain ATCC PRA-371 / ERTm2) TaxID=1913371 RepID=H8ZDW3_NEMA1|nr:hypothetical protein NERG_01784 [Nematocida ausubeli]
MQTQILSQLKGIKERLANLAAQRRCIPNTLEEFFPFGSAVDLLRKIENEENYLYVEAAKLKEKLFLHSTVPGKTSLSPEVWTMIYPENL